MNSHEATTQNYIQDGLLTIGKLGSPKSKEKTVVQLRRRGAVIVTAGALAVTGFVIKDLGQAIGDSYAIGSNIPTSVNHFDPKKEKRVPVPESGSWALALQYDPGHDPRNGVENFTEQLGHIPKPGENVMVEKPAQ